MPDTFPVVRLEKLRKTYHKGGQEVIALDSLDLTLRVQGYLFARLPND